MLWLVILLSIIFLYWVYDLYYNSHQYRLGKDIPGYKPWPIIGSAHLFAGNSEDVHKFCVKSGDLSLQHDGVYSLWLGPRLLTFLTDVNDVETVLTKYLGKPVQYSFFSDVLGAGLITLLDVGTWKRHRKIIQPSFNVQVLNNFVDQMHSNSMTLIKSLESEVGKGNTDILDKLGDSVFDTMFDTILDWKRDEPYDKIFEMPLAQLDAELSKMVFGRMTRVWLWCDAIFYKTTLGKKYKRFNAYLYNYIVKVFYKKREAIEKKLNDDLSTNFVDSMPNPKDKCFVNTMIIDKPQLTEEEMLEEIRTIVVAGFDTSVVSLSFALMLIGSHPDVQNKIYEELSSIYQGTDRPIVKDDLTQMTYLEYAIKESLRLYPPVTVYGREITSDLKLKNCTLPAGSIAFVMAWSIQRDEKLWGPDASEFKPERWMTKIKHPCAYVPFSYGVRNCVGMRYAMMTSKVILANILRNYKVTADISKSKIGLEILTKPIDGCNVELVKRNHL